MEIDMDKCKISGCGDVKMWNLLKLQQDGESWNVGDDEQMEEKREVIWELWEKFKEKGAILNYFELNAVFKLLRYL